MNDWFFFLCWSDREDQRLLIQARETTEAERLDAAVLAGGVCVVGHSRILSDFQGGNERPNPQG